MNIVSNKMMPGYIYKVNGTAQEQFRMVLDRYKYNFGNDIYGAANNNGNKTNNPFYSYWWLASPSSIGDDSVCNVIGTDSRLGISSSYDYDSRVLVVCQCCVVVCRVWLSCASSSLNLQSLIKAKNDRGLPLGDVI